MTNLFKAEVAYVDDSEKFNLFSDNKDQLVNILCAMVFRNPGLYLVIPIYNCRNKLVGYVGDDGRFKEA